ncbi:hypothetical protein GUITHDRAFT_79451 [Guillardia theta CCMP2712]|uniref:DNA-directed DNA polymerase family A palm domain-containing protein n=1 Tax=Guillardia theta (strain CCMP2712) TaxID=905079 RepID=L1IHN6_GUITC|nr:hypothetical protein GUITHDRAFT_79451 [Guillardia theta CCMP2712]EKX35753.1 hypothetical protein GUITHDRAFT_79451 [Guillardia theta CCMP2712]|eukprot:XP_005822733.1 hypothetical protein GUITHDRAFT_79451 [Guillardia theta CCMP2712]
MLAVKGGKPWTPKKFSNEKANIFQLVPKPSPFLSSELARPNASKVKLLPLILLELTAAQTQAEPSSRLVTVVRTEEDARAALEVTRLMQKRMEKIIFACDTETYGVDPTVESPVEKGSCACFSLYGGRYTTARRGKGKSNRLWVNTLGEEGEKVLAVFKVWFEDERFKKIFHNWSFDSHILRNHGITVRGFAGDTIHMARLWDASRLSTGKGYKLSVLSNELLGWGKTEMKEVFSVRKLKKDGTPGKVLILRDSCSIQTDDDPKIFRKWVHYSTYDSLCTWYLYYKLRKELEEMSWSPDLLLCMFQFYERFWKPFGEILTDIERTGIFIDRDYLRQQAAAAERDKEEKLAGFRRWVGKLCPDGIYMNTRSNLHKKHLLFSSKRGLAKAVEEAEEEHYKTFTIDNTEGFLEEGRSEPRATREIRLKGLGLSPVSYTPAGQASTSGSVISTLAGKPFADPPRYGTAFKDLGEGDFGKEVCEALGFLLESENVEKLLSTFLIPLPEMTDQHGRIHTALNLNTETGRLSSKRPNLQNQPALEKDVYKVSSLPPSLPPSLTTTMSTAITPALGDVVPLALFVCSCACSHVLPPSHGKQKDSPFILLFDLCANLFVFQCSWSSLLLPPPPSSSSLLPPPSSLLPPPSSPLSSSSYIVGLAKDWGVTQKEAQETIKAWYNARKEVQDWQEGVKKKARRVGYTETLLGRRRNLADMRSNNTVLRGHAERAAINTPIQGGAADVVVMAMLNIWRNEEIRARGWKMVLQIHDEVILEGPEDHAEEVFRIVKKCMENPFPRPLLVDLPVILERKWGGRRKKASGRGTHGCARLTER